MSKGITCLLPRSQNLDHPGILWRTHWQSLSTQLRSCHWLGWPPPLPWASPRVLSPHTHSQGQRVIPQPGATQDGFPCSVQCLELLQTHLPTSGPLHRTGTSFPGYLPKWLHLTFLQWCHPSMHGTNTFPPGVQPCAAPGDPAVNELPRVAGSKMRRVTAHRQMRGLQWEPSAAWDRNGGSVCGGAALAEVGSQGELPGPLQVGKPRGGEGGALAVEQVQVPRPGG